MEPPRQRWNDERMDEFAERTEASFREVRGDISVTRTEVRTEIRDEVQGLRTEMNARFALLEGKLDRRFDILFGALVTGFVGVVASHFLG
jgi:hypothetical protein